MESGGVMTVVPPPIHRTFGSAADRFERRASLPMRRLPRYTRAQRRGGGASAALHASESCNMVCPTPREHRCQRRCARGHPNHRGVMSRARSARTSGLLFRCIPDPHSKRQIKRGAPRTFPLPQKEADAGHFEQPRRRATGGGGQWVHAVEIASPRGGPDHVLSRSATAGHGAVSHHPPARGGSSQRMQLVAARPWFTSGSNNQSSTPAAKVLAMARKAPPALVAPRQRRCDRALPWAAMRFLGAVFGSCRHASAFEVRKDRPIANPLSMMC